MVMIKHDRLTLALFDLAQLKLDLLVRIRVHLNDHNYLRSSLFDHLSGRKSDRLISLSGTQLIS